MMKNIFLIISSLLLIISCAKKDGAAEQKFDHEKWMIAEEYDYPYRNSMLKDLMADGKLKRLKHDQILGLLGTPTRTDNGHLFYKISQTRFGVFPLHTKTMVIKLKPDSTVEWVKIHQ